MAADEMRPRALRVLLVEDELNIRNLLRQVLERGGYEVQCARSGEAALELLDEVFDLLLTDIVLGGISGQEVAAHFRETTPEMKIVFLSGWRVPGAAGGLADLVLTKPLGCQELLEALARLEDVPTAPPAPPHSAQTTSYQLSS
jgi:CheY-like chemotaxis protein